MSEIRIDPEFQATIAPLSTEERAQLEENLRRDGCRDPLVIWAQERLLIDGHNRYEICTRLGIEYSTTALEFSDREEVLDWIDANQLGRRNLTPDQMSLLRGRIYNRRKKAANDGGRGVPKATVDQNDPRFSTAETVGKQFGVSAPTVKRDGQFAATVEELKPYVPDIEQKVAAGEVKRQQVRDTAEALADVPEQDRADLVAKGEAEILARAKEIRAQKAAERRVERLEKIEQISRGNKELQTETRYPIIYADPPWRYENPPVGGSNRSIENHYPTMSLEEICDLPVSRLATDDAMLYMWATAPKLAECFKVIEAWGFEYRTNMVWDKEAIGMGYHARNQHEILLICKRGSIPPPAAGTQPASVYRERRGAHSAKPLFFYEMIEAAYPNLPKIELFCRSPRDGWAVWGNQSEVAA